ncbi:MAG: ATP synthase F1 subunit delta [Bacteroidia bacterium]|nr:ATP synthase F1 subunit delta [Bacteroidia bacterium]
MQDPRIASRYAKSLLDLASEQGALAQAYQDMLVVETCTKESRELVNLLNSPIIKSDKKEAIINEVFGSSISKLSLEFLQIITRKGRENYIPVVAASFVDQYRKLTGVTTAFVKSAIALDETARTKVRSILNQSGFANVELVEEVDAELIGGFVLRIGDKQVDTSVKNEISKLKQGFKENLYVEEI